MLDSGASRHMSRRKSRITDWKETSSYISFANGDEIQSDTVTSFKMSVILENEPRSIVLKDDLRAHDLRANLQ